MILTLPLALTSLPEWKTIPAPIRNLALQTHFYLICGGQTGQEILEKRISSSNLFDEMQRAFISADGSAKNITISDAILSDARFRRAQIHVATLDMAKAFDTIKP